MITKMLKESSSFLPASSAQQQNAQQSVHWTLGILRQSQTIFYASAFFQSDGFAPSAPAPVTQTVGWQRNKSPQKREK